MSTDKELAIRSAEQAKFAKLIEEDFQDRSLSENKIIKAKIIEIIQGKYVIVDVRGKSEPMIPISEFTETELSKLKVGDTIQCYLERIESFRSGEIVISYEKAKSIAAFEKCLEAYKNKEALTAIIKTRIKGGYIASLFNNAISAFLPQSHLCSRPLRGAAVDKLMNVPVLVHVVRADVARGNLSISRKSVLEQDRSAEVAEVIKDLKVGSIVDTVCKTINSWGAFCQYKNSVDILLHVSQMSHGKVSHPSDLVSEGDAVRLQIIKIDPKTNHISGSLKSMTTDPYQDVEKKYLIGEIYQSKVESVKEYGVFCNLEENISGLVHQSHLSHTDKHVKPDKVLKVGMTVPVKILSIDKNEKKISLSYKDTFESPLEKLKVNDVVDYKITNITDKSIFGELINFGNVVCFLHYKELNFSEDINELKKYKKNQIIKVKITEILDSKVKVSVRKLGPDPWNYFKEINKNVNDIITAKVLEVLKSGLKVYVDPDKKITTNIKKSDLAIEAADQRLDIYTKDIKIDCKILDLDFEKRILRLSPKAAQIDEQSNLIEKFGKKASTSGAKLASIFKTALGKKSKKKDK